jgi:hypothetical protein
LVTLIECNVNPVTLRFTTAVPSKITSKVLELGTDAPLAPALVAAQFAVLFQRPPLPDEGPTQYRVCEKQKLNESRDNKISV